MDGSAQPKPEKIIAAITAPTADVPAVAAKPRRKKQAGGVKETIESILIAFILAFIFRAFVVEAFVIPTGSMATTLMGAHMSFTCTDCGYKWRVNYNAQQTPSGDDLIIPPRAVVETRDGTKPRVYNLICPNCGFRVPRENPHDPDNQATAPPIDFGDRILVLKYLYLFTDPQRWDVVVFKSPADPKYQTNYIKRLVGKPTERVMVLDGDIYIGQKGDKLDDFKVQSKPHHAQEALWRIVYDNDFQPVNAGQQRYVPLLSGAVGEDPTWRQPWVEQPGGSGWKTGSSGVGDHAMTFNNLTGSSKLAFEPVKESLNSPLTNWMGYNVTMWQEGSIDAFERTAPSDPLTPYVSDLKLKLFYQRKAGDGPLRLELKKIDETFVAEFTPGKVRLLKVVDGADSVIAETSWIAPNRPSEVEFCNVDYRVSIRVDGEDLLATTPQQYAPNVAKLLADHAVLNPMKRPQISITADKQEASLQHVSLWRDVYYTNRERGQALRQGTPENPMELKADEFFVMGDNSSNSLDARFWSQPIKLSSEDLDVAEGRVPARFMLGKAFFVYWPAGLKLFNRWGLVPNVGEMRFIQ